MRQHIYIKTTKTAAEYQVWSIYERVGKKTRCNETGHYFHQMQVNSSLGSFFRDASLVRVHKKGVGLKVESSVMQGMPLYLDLQSALQELGYTVHPA